MSRLTDERRDRIARWLGETLLDMDSLTTDKVKAVVAKARAWMVQEELRDKVAKILEGGGNTKERLREILK